MAVRSQSLISSVTVRVAVDSLTRLRAFGRRFVHAYKLLALLILNVLVCLTVFELVSSAVVSVRTIIKGPEVIKDPRESSSYYATQPWAPLYWKEFHASRRQKYHPYVIWRREAFSGQTLNIDENGIRRTPGAVCGPESYKVFVLGGSTVWGTGSPDWGTLPAHLQTELQRGASKPTCVVNYGESAYVSTQSVLQLLLDLQQGNLPNLVISYEGPNDAYSAYQSGKASVHENLDQLVAAFEGDHKAEKSGVADLMRSMSLFSLTEDLVEKVTPHEEAPAKLLTYQTRGIDEASLIASVANTYLGNYDIVDSLSRKYGFEFRYVWPPYVTIGKKPLTAEERALGRAVDPPLLRLYESVYRSVVGQISKYPKLIDLTSVFDGHSELIWVDDMHVTPEGNHVVARKIAEVISGASGQALPPEEDGK